MRSKTCVSVLLVVALAGGAAAQPPASCEAEVGALRFLVQHFQAGRTAAEFEVARLQALSQTLQREVERLRQAEKPGGPK